MPVMRRVLVTVVVFMGIAAAVALYQRYQWQSAAENQVARLQTTTVERGDVVVSVRATGRVEAERIARLSFDVPGVVDAVFVEEGQSVEAGQVLAQLDGELQRIAVEQAEWALRIAELNLDMMQEPPDPNELDAAQAEVNSAWAAYVDLRDNSVDPEAIRIAELRYEQALTAMRDADQVSQDLRRSEASEAAVGAAGFSAEIARLQLERLREGPSQEALEAALARVSQAQARLNQLRAGPTQLEIDRAAVAVEQAALSLERAQAAYEDTVLRAPFAGVVNRVNVQVGGLATPAGLPAVEIVDLSRLHVMVDVDEVDIAQVSAGQPVELRLDALPDEAFSGVVGRVANEASQREGVVVYELRLDIAEAGPSIRPGMTAAATIIVQEVRDVLVVPNLYIRLDRQRNEAFVNVIDEAGRPVERAIELGAQNDTVSQVRAGLREGDVIAIDLDASGFSFFEANR